MPALIAGNSNRVHRMAYMHGSSHIHNPIMKTQMHKYVCIYIYICKYVYIYIYIYIYIFIYLYEYVLLLIRMYTHAHVLNSHIHLFKSKVCFYCSMLVE